VPLVTGLGIGGLAFAFAAKDTIENFFGSVTVLLDRPFEVGDWVIVGDTEGTVEELGLRSTRIRTFYNSQVTVPNATLVRATVDNLGRRAYRRWKTYLGVQYDTPPETLLAFTEGIRELVRQHPYTRKDFYQVWCNDFADFSLNILLYVFFRVPDWSTELRERERLFVDIVRLADRLGVQFAFPTRTVHLYREEHRPHEIAYEIPAGAHDSDATEAGVRAAREITAEQPWQKDKPGPVRFEVGKRRHRDRERGGS
jgi:MscS family membrane protein